MTFDSNTTYYQKARSGRAYIISELYNISSGNTQNIHLRNPASNDMRFWVMEITVSSDTPYIANVHDVFDSSPTGGTEIKIQNVLLDADSDNNDGKAVANENVSFSSSSSHAVGVGGSGSGGQTGGFTISHPPIVIEPNREILLNVENTSSGSGNYALTIVYYETPTSNT